MKKILLAGGCSYTDPNFKSTATQLPDEQRSGWPMWPELMGKSLDLKVIKMHRPNEDQSVSLSGKAFALITKRISSPNYSLDIGNEYHLKFLKEVWKDKTIYPTLLNKKKFIAIFGKKFYVENPKFRLDKQKRFCRIVRKRYMSTDSHLRLRNKIKGKVRKLDDKYGNVLYCEKDKQWYFVDLD